MDDSENEQTLYFVMWEPEEESFSIIPHTDAIYDSKVRVNDKLTFFWNKKKHTGDVRFVSEDYEECITEMRKLKSLEKKKHKRERSFHASSPRKSKLRCQERVTNQLKRGVKMVSDTSHKVPKQKLAFKDLSVKEVNQELLSIIKDKSKSDKSCVSDKLDDEQQPSTSFKRKSPVMPSVTSKADSDVSVNTDDSSDSDNTDDASDSCSASEIKKSNKDNLQLALKLSSELAAKYDIQILQGLVSGRVDPETLKGLASPTPASSGCQRSSGDKCSPQHSTTLSLQVKPNVPIVASKPMRVAKSVPAEADYIADNYHFPDVDPIIPEDIPEANPIPPAEIHAPAAQEGLGNMYQGNMFIVNDPENGVALNKQGKPVYCSKAVFDLAEKATSAPMAGRRLLSGVFTKEAIMKCSLSGLPPRGKGKGAYTDKTVIKPYLCPVAVQAIVDKALELQKSKHWHPKKDASQVRQAMAVRINEISSRSAGNE